MSGVRGSYWDGLDRKIILEKTGNADFNLMKCWILSHIRINIGAIQASPGIIKDHQEWSPVYLEWSWVIPRNHEIWLRHDVSAHQNDGAEAFSLCWRTMLHHINIKSINTWCEALSSRWPVDARLPKCPSVTFLFFMQEFGIFSGIIISSCGLSHQSFSLGN